MKFDVRVGRGVVRRFGDGFSRAIRDEVYISFCDKVDVGV